MCALPTFVRAHSPPKHTRWRQHATTIATTTPAMVMAEYTPAMGGGAGGCDGGDEGGGDVGGGGERGSCPGVAGGGWPGVPGGASCVALLNGSTTPFWSKLASTASTNSVGQFVTRKTCMGEKSGFGVANGALAARRGQAIATQVACARHVCILLCVCVKVVIEAYEHLHSYTQREGVCA